MQKSGLWTRRQQEDLPNAAFLPQRMCFCRIAQRHPATHRQNELAIAHVIGKLPHLGGIRLGEHTLNLDCRILGRRACSGKKVAYPKEPPQALSWRSAIRCNVTAHGIRNCIHQVESLNRLIVINREHVRDTEGACVIQSFPPNARNHLRA